ncbi:hypothetical protein DITRI_Ditri04bG0155200 [Diplodiscus trichospermus]
MSRLTRPLGAVALLRSLYSQHLLLNSRPVFSQPISLLPDFKQFTPIKPLQLTTFSTCANPPIYKNNNNGGDFWRNEKSDSLERRKVELPEELSKNVMVLTCESSAEGGNCDVYLVGTVHVSQACVGSGFWWFSWSYAREELRSLLAHTLSLLHSFDLLLHSFSNHLSSASKLGVSGISEFRVAYEEAMKYGGKVILGDRPEQVRYFTGRLLFEYTNVIILCWRAQIIIIFYDK